MMYIVIVKHDSVELSSVYLLQCRLLNFVLNAWLNKEMNEPGFVCDAGTFRTGIEKCTKVQKVLEPHKEKRCTGR